MTLRTRLILGYGFLVALLVITAVSAAAGFFGLSKGIDRILKENFASIESSTQMVEALERQDSATFKILLGHEDGHADLRSADKEFLEALSVAKSNITVPAETGLLEDIDEGFKEYRRARDRLLGAPPDRPLAEYNRDVFPLFNDVKSNVLELLDINHQAMIAADENARSAAMRNGVWLGILVVLGVLSFVLLTRALQNQVLSRLEAFEDIGEAIASGDEFRRLPTTQNDELGMIARHFNTALDRLEHLKGNMKGRLVEQRGMVVALLQEIGDADFVLGLDGEVIAEKPGDMSIRDTEGFADDVANRIRREFSESRERAAIELPGVGVVDLRLLATPSGRPIGWIGQVRTSTDLSQHI